MSDIFKEVDEAMQQEKWLNIWNEYKATIVGAIALLLISASGTTFYKNWDFGRDAEETAKLIQALDANDSSAVLANIKEDTRGGHSAIATLTAAAMALENQNQEKASSLYLEVANKRNAPKDLRDLARVLYTKNTSDADMAVLKPVLSNKKSPWLWHAKIEAAVTEASNDNIENAIAHLEGFAENNTLPLALKQRAAALKHVYTLRMADKNTADNAPATQE